MKYLFAFLTIFCIMSCHSRKDGKSVVFSSKIGHSKVIRYASLGLDSVQLDSISTSYSGESYIAGGNICFVDKKFCYLFKFDNRGKLIDRYMGQGNGKNELPIKNIMYSSPRPEGGFFFMGPSWDCFIYDKDFNRIDDYAINWHPQASKEAMLKKPDPSETQLYSLPYGFGTIRVSEGKVYMPILSQHPSFNPTIPAYYKDARTMAKMDLETGYVNEIYGRFPPVYVKNKNLATFGFSYFDLTPGNTMQVSFPVDSLIYRCSRDFEVLDAFGMAGRDMDTNYHSVADVRGFRKNFYNEMKGRGYYTGLEYIDERGLTFRSYHKSEYGKTDGLQIYKADTLIADVDVPKNFKVDGYISPFFYSNSFIDEQKGAIKLYRFKLD